VLLSDETDEALMLRYQKGEVRAFEILLTRHRRGLYNFIFRFVGSREAAEDLLQEAFLRVIKGAGKYERQAKFTTWLYTIARNLCVDHSRRMKHRRVQSLDAPVGTDSEGGKLLDLVASSDPGAARNAVAAQLGIRLQNAIAALSDEQREVFLMREFHQMPFKDIAEVVGVSENTVKSRMRYALDKLRVELNEYADLVKAAP
jgi:RNA polymerase sigma-70 factor, ECF subfamily